MRTPGDVDARVAALYGPFELAAAGVLHPSAVWRGPDGALVTLRIGPATPKSPTDAFALALARARADAIVTTGRILREEPDLTHALPLPPAEAEALLAWRRERLGRAEPPWSLVLSSGRDLDLGHPLFRGPTRPVVFTGSAAARALAPRAEAARVRVLAHPQPALASALDHLRRVEGCAVVSVEAGPTTAAALYGEPPLVDELLLSIYEEPGLSEALRGPAFVAPARLDAVLAAPARVARVREESGRWSFVRRLRAGRAAGPAAG